MVAYSSGNHAQAVALAARILGIPATIVMPHDAPAAKVAATRGYGGRGVRYDRYTEDREAIGAALADERGLTLVPPYDHPDVIAGQGTAALELFEEVGALDALFVPLGGGGLLSGTALAAEALAPACRVYGVEPEAGDDGRRSLRRGRDRAHRHARDHRRRRPDPRTSARTRSRSSSGRSPRSSRRPTPSSSRPCGCSRPTMKLVVEPTGCLGLAAVRPRRDLRGQRVGVLVSGGNVDLDRYAALLRGYNYLVSDANDNMEAGTITIACRDGDEIEAYLARPTSGAPAAAWW